MSSFKTSTEAVQQITVIDPTSRYGKLHVPMNMTFDTKGRAEWIKFGGNLKKDLSICCLFQKGKCHVGERCFQVHIDRTYVNDLRKKYANVTTCCIGCGDVHSNSDAFRGFMSANFAAGCVGFSFSANDATVEIPSKYLANTIGLEESINRPRDGITRRRDGTFVFPFGKVCRLHLKNSCKYGRDCKNIHVCHKVSDKLVATPSSSMNKLEVPRTALPVITIAAKSSSPAWTAAVDLHSETALYISRTPSQDAGLSDDSHNATPELQSRTGTPSRTDSPVEVMSIGSAAVEFATGAEFCPTEAAMEPYARFQWQCRANPSTESLNIIFNGFPSVL